MTGPGDLRARLVLEHPVETADGAGGVTRGFAATATIWAAVTPVSARGDVDADGLAATVTHRITIRRRADVTTRHRLREGARIFRIVSLRDQDGRGRFIEIEAQVRSSIEPVSRTRRSAKRCIAAAGPRFLRKYQSGLPGLQRITSCFALVLRCARDTPHQRGAIPCPPLPPGNDGRSLDE